MPTKVQWIKRGLVRPPKHPLVEVALTPEQFDCVACGTTHALVESNIRCRILRGYRYLDRGFWRYCDTPHADVKCYPMYGNGRVCSKCSPKYHLVTDKPTALFEMQMLKDVVAVNHSNRSITRGDVDLEDALNEIEAEHKAKTEVKMTKIGRIIAPLVDTDHVAVRPVDPKSEIDTNAFRRYCMNRSGGLKDYHKRVGDTKLDEYQGRFDSEVNYSNQKKG